MIIEFQTFSNSYKEKILNNKQPFGYTCPKCGAKSKFHRHGTYVRYMTRLSANGAILFEEMELLRLKCKSCNSTHSILPGDIIPFQVYSLPVVLFLCEQILQKNVSLRQVQRKTKCKIQTIYQKRNLLKQNLHLIEFYLRQLFLYTAATSISLIQALSFLLSPTMDFLAYFHCHGQPIFLNRRNTISYPLYFEASFSGIINPT